MSNLLLALIQKLHGSHECDAKTSKEDEDLVTVLVLGGIVGREEHHC